MRDKHCVFQPVNVLCVLWSGVAGFPNPAVLVPVKVSMAARVNAAIGIVCAVKGTKKVSLPVTEVSK